MTVQETRSRFDWAERELTSRAADDLPALDLADEVSDLIGKVLQAVALPERSPAEQDNEWKQTKALMYLGLLAGRSLRGIMLLLRAGYDAEALILKRRLIEIHARADRITHPTNGPQHATAWLEGQDGGEQKVTRLPQEDWASYSRLAHADYRAVENHLARRDGSGRTTFSLLPQRHVERANLILLASAVETRDVAATIVDFKRGAIDGLDALDAKLRAALLAAGYDDAE